MSDLTLSSRESSRNLPENPPVATVPRDSLGRVQRGNRLGEGRPPGHATFKRMVHSFLGKHDPENLPYRRLEVLLRRLYQKAVNGDAAAAQYLINQGAGKAKAMIEADYHVTRSESPAQLRARLLERLAALQQQQPAKPVGMISAS